MKSPGAARQPAVDLSRERIHMLERLLAGQPLDAIFEDLALGLEHAIPGSVVFLTRRDDDLLRIISGTPSAHALTRALPPVHITGGDSMCSVVIQQGGPAHSTDLGVDGRWPRVHQWARKNDLRAAAVWPVVDHQRRPVGTVCAVFRVECDPAAAYGEVIAEYAALAGVALEFHEVINAAQYDARHDSLTGLANRRQLLEQLREELSRAARGDGVAVLLLDLDDFKRVNDLHGHAAGDVLLGIFAERLRAAVRGSDTVARLGGDEFVVLMRGVREDEARETAQRVASVLREPVTLDRDVIRLTPSQGLALAADFPEASAEALLDAADAAMYSTKQQGKDGLRMAGESTGSHSGLDARLVEAFENEELLNQRLLLDSWRRWRGDNLIGRQLVLSWFDQDKGRIPMHRLVRNINMAEVRHRLQLTIRQVVRDRLDPAWFRDGQVVATQPPRSALLDPDYPGFLQQCLIDKSSPSAQMELDLTELLGDPLDSIRSTALRLRQRNPGIALAVKALDRASLSLEHLQAVGPDVIKVSPFRVLAQMQDRANAVTVLQSLRLLGEAHGATVVADQIHSADDLELAEQAGIRLWQGSYQPN
ncbi:MAG: diguanylate cyclase [Ectothiorhodospiraceae bacterium]|nr:diguanylate cyclase [Ectothiorhodospiraceae bacterium]